MFHPLPAGVPLVAALLALAPLSSAQGNATDLAQRANEALGLERSQLQSLPILTEHGTVKAIVQLGNQPLLLDLEPHSVFAPDFKLYAQVEDGSIQPVAVAPELTLRGAVIGSPGSQVAASLLDDGLYARILLADGQEYWLEPIARLVEGARAEHHVLYDVDDVLETSRSCATDTLSLSRSGDPTVFGSGTYNGSAGLSVAELACDADFEYYQDHGSSVTNVQNRIGSVINTMNMQYESEVGITHVITAIVVRTTSNDPYSSTDAETLLNQFRNEWNANQGGIARDVAHLFTGKGLNGGTIGIAWLSAVCSSFGYGLVESDFNNNFSCTTDLSAHELGHNWGANHCSCTNFTMNPFITCANQFNPSISIPAITSFRDSINCLSSGVAPPTADFSGSPLTGEAPLTVNFTSLTTGQVDSYLWFFDGFASSTAANPSYTFTSPGTYFVSLEVSGPGGNDTEFKINYITVESPTGGGAGTYYVSFLTTASVPGVGNRADEDIVAFDVATQTWSPYFDGSDVGLAQVDVNAIHMASDGSIVMSLDAPFSVPGLIGGPNGILVDDSDLVRFIPTSTGNNTAGSFVFLFDGSDVGYSTNGEDIDGVYEFSSGELLISTVGNPSAPGFGGTDEDVAFFLPTQLGAVTSGFWSLYFDGSDVGFGGVSAHDLDAISMSGSDLLFSTAGTYAAAGGSGADEDVSRFTGSFGATTTGSATKILDLSTLGIIASENVDGLSFVP